MGGEIHVESEEGKGSIFSFILPGLQLSDRRPGIPEETSSKTDWPVMPPRIADRRILLAEDNEVNRKIIRMVLERDGAIIEDATTGLEVIEKVSQKSFDMILMDIEMPEMDGLEATRVIRRGEAGEENRRIPVIAITAHVIDDVRDRCIKAGMDGFLTKPIDVKNVVTVISGYLTS
jgi:CheY-like chemotaxis protein